MRVFIAFIAIAVVVGIKIDNIECPINGNPETVTVDDCVPLACEFTNGKCHMKKNDEAGYIVASDAIDTGRGFKVSLTKANVTATFFGTDVEELLLEFIYHEEYHLQIKITDPSANRYEIPFGLNLPDVPAIDSLYNISFGDVGKPLVIDIQRKSNAKSIFRSVGPLTFEDQFIQFSTSLLSYDLYGLGENYHRKLRHTFAPRATYPIFSVDKGTANPGEHNHYGAHPYYVNVEDSDGNTHSVLFYNSNAMEYSTFLLDDGTPALTFRTIGGIIDLHLFLGPTPEDVNMQYAQTVGLPNLPPYWSLGFTLSRWNYGSTDGYREVRDRMRAEQIPMDVQTFDIDYMDGRRDFTYDPVNWGDFPFLIQELHDENIYVTLMFDPAIAIDWDTYPTSQRGKDADVFIKWASSEFIPTDQLEGAQDYIVGRVWPDSQTVFPDFLNPITKEWWTNETKIFHNVAKFDAMWIDMNEPSNFDTNLSNGVNRLFCPVNNLDDPPYGTKVAYNDINRSKRLSDVTICMMTNHTDGISTFYHYDMHSLYGITETMATYDTMNTLFPGKRKAILSRSTFVGSGHYAIHWLGDNYASWEQMGLSIVGMIEFNMFGMPMVGADICGFSGNSTEELCARWMELGAFYPYSRNHNDFGSSPQDPAYWPVVAEISRKVLHLRYKYLPYLYSLLHRSNSLGHSVIRPVFNVFPTDPVARDINDQFFWGDGIMVAPVLVPYAVTRGVYFPKSIWYDLETGEWAEIGPKTRTVDAPLDKIPVYARGGIILPFQNPAVTTTLSRQDGFGFTVALDEKLEAAGEVFWDDGVTDNPSSAAFLATMSFDGTEFRTVIIQNAFEAEGIDVQTIDFLGFPSKPTSVVLNGNSLSETFWSYNSTSSILQVKERSPLNGPIHLIITR